MHALSSIIRSVADIIRLGAAFDVSGMSFEVGADDIIADLEYGRS